MSNHNDSLEELLDTITGIADQCEEVKDVACEMASEITLECNSAFELADSLRDTVKGLQNPTLEDQLEESIDGLNQIVMKSAALGGVIGILQDVYEPLRHLQRGLETRLNKEAREFHSILHRPKDSSEWRTLSRAEFLSLPLLDRATILLDRSLLFLDQTNEPLQKVHCLRALGGTIPSLSGLDGPQAKCSVLILDDDQNVLKLLEDVLSRRMPNISVVKASSVKEAEGCLNQELDLAFLDVRLPDGNGIDILRRIRSCDHIKNMPVFVMTALPTPEIREEAKQNFVSGFIDKSQTSQAVKTMVDFARMYATLR